jgi:D-erythronate 2-dehydrogenase
MTILIIGAAGMIGQRLARALQGQDLILADMVPPPDLPGARAMVLDIAHPEAGVRMVASRPQVIFHLAAVVSGESESNFEKGYASNLDATRSLLEAIRALPDYRPRVIFTSSIAVFGPPFPEALPDDFLTAPRTSYGTQKAISELLLADYTRRGFLDGMALRMPTICIRPGKANLAASGFFSNILREPLVGLPAVLPVPDTVRHWFASPRAAVDFLTHAMGLDHATLGGRITLNMPGLSATVAEEIEALRRVAGQAAVDLIRVQPDEVIARIVASWPENFQATRAKALGFVAETSFDQIIQAHLDGA